MRPTGVIPLILDLPIRQPRPLHPHHPCPFPILQPLQRYRASLRIRLRYSTTAGIRLVGGNLGGNLGDEAAPEPFHPFRRGLLPPRLLFEALRSRDDVVVRGGENDVPPLVVQPACASVIDSRPRCCGVDFPVAQEQACGVAEAEIDASDGDFGGMIRYMRGTPDVEFRVRRRPCRGWMVGGG